VVKVRPISNDKRKNIVEAKERGESVETIIKWLKVSKASIGRIWSKYKKTGSYKPVPYVGRKSTIFNKKMNNKIMKKVKEKPDITQTELIDELKLNVTVAALSLHMKKLGLTLKKRLLIQTDKKEKTSLKKEKNGQKTKKI